MKIVVPMAGRGSRFQALSSENSEYKKPKPFIMVKDKPMVVWAVESLPFVHLPNRPATTKINVSSSDLIFIFLDEHEKKYQATAQLQNLFGSEITAIIIPEVTRGAVETVLQAKDYINTSEDIVITDCDNYFDGSNLYTAIQEKEPGIAGIIPVFQPPDREPKWSYTLFNSDMIAIAVGEKDPQLAAKGAYANIGAYYFSQGRTFVSEAEEMIQDNDMYGAEGREEFYVAPLYQRLIQKGMKIKAAVTSRIWGLGTPRDLEYFLQNFHE